MSAAEVARAAEDPVVEARLDSCVFKGAVKEQGEWKAVPMCKMNEANGARFILSALRLFACQSAKAAPAGERPAKLPGSA